MHLVSVDPMDWSKHFFFILLKRSIGLAGMAPFYGGVSPLQDPNKYLDGTPDTTCYGARLGCKFHSIQGYRD